MPTIHKNKNESEGNYAIYQIVVLGVIYKIGKADLDRVTQSSGNPTRIHQQLRKLRIQYGVENVFYVVLESLFGYKTKVAKAFETAILDMLYTEHNFIPEGNKKSYKPKK